MTVRVLLVDDVPELRRVVATSLRLRGGFEVIGEVGDGESAVRLAAELQPDIIVLDLGLPSLKGGELLAELRKAAPEAKVAVFTGLTTPEGEALRGHVEGYVPKDSDIAALIDLLADLGGAEQQVAVLDLPADRESIGPAREFLTFHAQRWGYLGDLYEAELVVNELVDNSVTHAGTPFSLRLSLGADALQIEVADRGAGTPEPRLADQAPTGRTHWRGLGYISLLAQGWGVLPAEDGRKVVWARLAPPPPVGAARVLSD